MAALIRLAERADSDALAAIYRPAVTDGAISFEIEPPDVAAMAARVEKTLHRLPWIVYEAEGAVAGYAYGSPYRDRPAYQWSVEVSAYVRQDARRAGIARALYTSLFAILALQGYRSAYAGITLPNEASVGFHRAMGFTPVGTYHGVGYKFGAWHDVGWFERPLAPRDSEPGAPVALPSLVDEPTFNAAIATGLARAAG